MGPGGGECQAPGAQRVEKGLWPLPGCIWRRLMLPWAWPGLEALWWEGPPGSQMYEAGGSLDPQQTWRWWVRLERWTVRKDTGQWCPSPSHTRVHLSLSHGRVGAQMPVSLCAQRLWVLT